MAITAKKGFLSTAPKKTCPEAVSPWLMLAYGIVERAVMDYRRALKKHHRLMARIARTLASGKKVTDREKWAANIARLELQELEDFFRSDWFSFLSDTDGRSLLARLQKEVEI